MMSEKPTDEETKNAWSIQLRVLTPRRRIECETERVIETSDDARALLVGINQIKDTIEAIYEEVMKEARR